MTARLLPNVPADQYHNDQVGDTPTLSASIAKVLLDQSPAHAKAQHPKLNPNYERKTDDKFDIGTAVHKLLLEGESVVEIIVADNFRTKVAQEQRDQARAHGRIPLLAKDADQVIEMVQAIAAQLARFDLPALTDGAVEQTFLWNEDGVACRARLDWFVPARRRRRAPAREDPQETKRSLRYGKEACHARGLRRGVAGDRSHL